jgi:hypothetical protein
MHVWTFSVDRKAFNIITSFLQYLQNQVTGKIL